MPRKPLYYDSENGKKEVLGTSGSFEQVPDAPTSALPVEYPATYSAMQTSITSNPSTKRDFFVSADETNGGLKTSYRYNGTSVQRLTNDITLTTLTDSATIVWDCNTGFRKKVSLTNTVGQTRSLAITNASAGQSGILEITHTDANTVIELTNKDSAFKWGSVAGDVTIVTWFYNGNTFRFSSAVYGTAVDPTRLTSLAISTSTNVSGNNEIYSQTVPDGTNWGGTVLWSKKLASGSNGYVQQSVDISKGMGMLGFKTTAVEGGFLTFDAAAYFAPSTGVINVMDAGSHITSVGTVSDGDLLKVDRVGSTFKLFKSSDNGNSWTAIYTFTFTSASDMFPISDIRGDGQVKQPKGYNLI